MSDAKADLASLRLEARELWIPNPVPRIPWHPTALAFHRDFVSNNTPVVLTGVPLPPWAASPKTLSSFAGDSVVTISRTPGGWGDVVRDGVFVKPARSREVLDDFLRDLIEPSAEGVPYYSAQDDCLRRELPELGHGLPDMSFARGAFSADAEAVNLWVGDARSVTSMHNDHYENMYLVTCGAKEFTLLPPTDFPLLRERTYPAATFEGSKVVRDVPEASVAWVAEPEDWECEKVVVEVEAGEMLYLPSLWYHRVRQRGVTIAVNFWYDMCFNSPAFVYYQFLRRLTARLTEQSKLGIEAPL